MIRILVFFLLLHSLLPTGAWAAPLVAAHRGLVIPGTTENSVEAIRAAVAAGVDVVEIDLRMTADGVIVLAHDATLDRVTTGRGRVARLTLAEVRAIPLKAGGGRIATFEEALDATRSTATRLLLDLKVPGGIDPASIVTLAESHGALDRIIVGVRSVADVRAFRRLEPSVPILGFVPAQADMEEFIAAGANIIRLWARWIALPATGCARGASPACLVQRLQARGLRIWTVADSPSADETASICFQWLAALELDGILTNQPLLARQATVGKAGPASGSTDLRRCPW